MEVLLAIVGAAIALGVGWAFGRAGRPLQLTEPRGASQLAASPSVADVLEDHPTGVVLFDPGGRVEFRNATARAMAGTHVGVLVDEVVERRAMAARRGVPAREVVELYGPPRSVMVVEARATPDGGAVVFVDDISEQRRVEQVRTDFVANISHELKTPIGALSVLAEALEGEIDPTTVRRLVDRMQGEASRAARTIDDLLELSRIELGGERAYEPVRVADIVRDAIERVTELAAQREIRISTLDPVDADGHRSERLVVHGDRRQLVSAVGNLVENAVKYSEPGGLVQVRARRDDGWVEIAVIDQGVGIPQRDLNRIFERFYRVDRARSRATGGTGLGLSIVRHVATNHAGEVVVRSTEGEGSTFVLRLPSNPSTADRDAGGSAPPASSAPPPTEGVA